MTPNQEDVLEGLSYVSTDAEVARHDASVGFRPLDIGGGSGSHHSVTLARLTERGWVERNSGCGWFGGTSLGVTRPTWRYRITAKGRQALANWKATKPHGR